MYRNDHCATCGKKRRALESARESWGLGLVVAGVPRPEQPEGRPWQKHNELICNAAVWRNGGTSEDCHLCDDCLRIGLRRIKLEVDKALEATEKDADKDKELADQAKRICFYQWKIGDVLLEVENVVALMDGLAETWGDEGVFRRCRDRLRKLVKKGEAE